MAATTMSIFCERAASRIKKGNLPLPAMRPYRSILGVTCRRFSAGGLIKGNQFLADFIARLLGSIGAGLHLSKRPRHWRLKPCINLRRSTDFTQSGIEPLPPNTRHLTSGTSLLNHSPLALLNEFDQYLNLGKGLIFFFEESKRLGGIEFGF
jgi:hypothetical protein